MSIINGFSIGLLLDPKTEGIVRGFWKSLHDMGMNQFFYNLGTVPHIPAVAVDESFEEGIHSACQKLAKKTKAFTLSFELAAMFTTKPSSVIWMPTPTLNLLKLQEALHAAMEPFSTFPPQGYYLPKRWMPHVGLASRVGDKAFLPSIVKSALVFPSLHRAIVRAIGVFSYQPLDLICTYPLLDDPSLQVREPSNIEMDSEYFEYYKQEDY